MSYFPVLFNEDHFHPSLLSLNSTIKSYLFVLINHLRFITCSCNIDTYCAKRTLHLPIISRCAELIGFEVIRTHVHTPHGVDRILSGNRKRKNITNRCEKKENTCYLYATEVKMKPAHNSNYFLSFLFHFFLS